MRYSTKHVPQYIVKAPKKTYQHILLWIMKIMKYNYIIIFCINMIETYRKLIEQLTPELFKPIFLLQKIICGTIFNLLFFCAASNYSSTVNLAASGLCILVRSSEEISFQTKTTIKINDQFLIFTTRSKNNLLILISWYTKTLDNFIHQMQEADRESFICAFDAGGSLF